jgi:putative CRISPR-associated protein (TIGR02620 family)
MKTNLEMALDQIEASRRKGSKSAAWACAEYAAELAGVSIVYPEEGRNWPDLARLEKDVRAACADTVIVTRHTGMVEWLARRGITGRVIAHAYADDVRGKRVIGVLPLHLAAEAAEVVSVDMPLMKTEDRGRDLMPDEMDAAGATMKTYQVFVVAA